MKHRITRDLYAYWQVLRRDRPAPDRSEIEPSEIRTLLGDTFILELADDRTYRFRLAGTRVCALYGRELKGQDIARLWSGKDRDTISSLLAAITEEAAAAVVGFEGKTDYGRTLPVECLLLPVRQTGPGYRRVLGSFAPMQQPYWLGLHPLMSQTISSLRLIWPGDNRPFLRRGDDPDLEPPAIAPAATLPRIGGERRVAHLTVYEGGKQ
jgi:hypothetical protein